MRNGIPTIPGFIMNDNKNTMGELQLDEVTTIFYNMLEMSTVETLLAGMANAIEQREMYCRSNWPTQPETFQFLTENLTVVRSCLSQMSDLGKQRVAEAEVKRNELLEVTKAERAKQDEQWKAMEDEIILPLLTEFDTVLAGRKLTVEPDPNHDHSKDRVLLNGVDVTSSEKADLDRIYGTLMKYETHRNDVFDAFVACGLRQPKPVPMAPPPPLSDNVTLMTEAIVGLVKFGAQQDEIDKLLEIFTLKGFNGEEETQDANHSKIALAKLEWLRNERMFGREI